MMNKVIIFSFFLSSIISAQKVNIIEQLKKIEAGKIEEVKIELAKLKINNSADPDVIFLEAVITEDGERANNFYELIYNDFPQSKFADAALFRSFSFYYSLGLYKKAEALKDHLKKSYPNSPYLKNTERSFPEIDEMLIVDSNPYNLKSKTDKQFTVQAGAFSNYKNAEMLKSKFMEDGLSSIIKPKVVNNLQLHIVTVGNFTTRTEADKFLTTLERDYSIKGRVIKID